MRTVLARATAAGLVAAAATLATAAPASAAPPTITFLAPVGSQALVDSAVTISARVSINGKLTAPITLKVTSSHPTINASVPAESPPQTVNFPVTLNFNGPYKATITAKGKSDGLFTQEETAERSLDFVVAAPPGQPTGVKAAVDTAERTVAVTWKANTEPDLLRYEVLRAKPGSNDFAVVARPKATETSYADASTTEAGGTYRYLVVAVRRGGSASEEIRSNPSTVSADSSAAVPDPPPPPTTAAPPTTAGSTGSTGTTDAAAAGGARPAGTASSVPAGSPGALATSGSVDLSGFNAVRSQARASSPRTVPLPDPGFEGTLPFAPGGAPEQEEEEAGEIEDLAADSGQFRELGAEDTADDRARTMAFFAAGLLSTVLLMHVLWVKSEVKRAPLEALEPDGPRGSGGGPGRDGTDVSALAATGPDDFGPVVVPTGSRPRRSKVATGA